MGERGCQGWLQGQLTILKPTCLLKPFLSHQQCSPSLISLYLLFCGMTLFCVNAKAGSKVNKPSSKLSRPTQPFPTNRAHTHHALSYQRGAAGQNWAILVLSEETEDAGSGQRDVRLVSACKGFGHTHTEKRAEGEGGQSL